MNISLPNDVNEDLQHFKRQLRALQFTETELEASEDIELAANQLTARKAREESAKQSANDLSKIEEAEGAGGPPTGAINNIKPFKTMATATATAIEEGGAQVAGEGKQLDENWEASEDADEDDYITVAKEEDDDDQEDQGTDIPPPDEGIIEMLDKQGVAYVSLDDDKTTALPPGFPVKGAVESGDADLPNDPFSMEEGSRAQVEEGARLGSTTLQELSAMKS